MSYSETIVFDLEWLRAVQLLEIGKKVIAVDTCEPFELFQSQASFQTRIFSRI